MKRMLVSGLHAAIMLACMALSWGCTQNVEHKVVVCVPVYGQSLALGEEAERVTDFETLANSHQGRIVTENLDHEFGYFEPDKTKEVVKKLVHYQKRAFELSVYSMAEVLADALGEDSVICTFPGGQGATPIAKLKSGTPPYQKFVADIRKAYEEAQAKGWDFYVPAICWMQGESDIVDYPETDYRALLLQFHEDVNRDVKAITHQSMDVRLVCYQSTSLSKAERFSATAFNCVETATPQTQMELVRDDTLFWASGPTYPYDVVREVIHIDGVSQHRFGQLAARSVLGIIRGQQRFQGLVPLSAVAQGNDVIVHLNVPCPPLKLDTTLVNKIRNYGFCVVTPGNEDIAQCIQIEGDSIRISCTAPATGCKVRYGVNGEAQKSGRLNGPRGNLRDSQGDAAKARVQGHDYPLHNWCYLFDIPLP